MLRPRPLRTVRASFPAYGSSNRQRAFTEQWAKSAHLDGTDPRRPCSQPWRSVPMALPPRQHAVAPLALGPTWTLLRQCRLPSCLRWREPHQQRPLRSRRHFCFAPYAGWLTVHVRLYQREVGTLARGVMSQPLSGPLQAGLRLLPPPLPAGLSGHLTTPLAVREQQDNGLILHAAKTGSSSKVWKLRANRVAIWLLYFVCKFLRQSSMAFVNVS